MTNIKINKIIENIEKNNEKIMKNIDKYNKIIKELSDIEEIICSNINIIKESHKNFNDMLTTTQNYLFIITKNCNDE